MHDIFAIKCRTDVFPVITVVVNIHTDVVNFNKKLKYVLQLRPCSYEMGQPGMPGWAPFWISLLLPFSSNKLLMFT